MFMSSSCLVAFVIRFRASAFQRCLCQRLAPRHMSAWHLCWDQSFGHRARWHSKAFLGSLAPVELESVPTEHAVSLQENMAVGVEACLNRSSQLWSQDVQAIMVEDTFLRIAIRWWVWGPSFTACRTTQASARTLHATVGQYGGVRDMVWANRGITYSTTTTRKPPHAFNFLRQVDCLVRAGQGGADQQFADPSRMTMLVCSVRFFWHVYCKLSSESLQQFSNRV